MAIASSFKALSDLAKAVKKAPRDDALALAQYRASLPIEQGGLGLPSGNTPMERAAAMGAIPQYHGTNADVTAIDLARAGEKTGNPNARLGFFSTPTADEASRYATGWTKEGANVMPLMVMPRKTYKFTNQELNGLAMLPFEIMKTHPSYSIENGVPKEVILKANKTAGNIVDDYRADLLDKGYDSGIVNAGGRMEERIALDPSIVRSRFAAFDPFLKDSADLLAGLAPYALPAAGIAGAASYSPQSEAGIPKLKLPKAPYDQALADAQVNASLPIKKGGLGLPLDNTAMDRARAMGYRAPDYQGLHTPPMSDSGAPLHDLTGGGTVYPDDVYSYQGAQYYGTGEPGDASLFAKLRQFKGDPEARAKVWRAVPKDVYQREGNMIHHGDWVTPSRQYAVEHGEGALGGEYSLQASSFPAKTLFTNGDSPYEFGLDKSQLFAEGPASIPIMTSTQFGAGDRSKFAAFDPLLRNSADLLAGLAPYALPAAGLYGASTLLPDQQQPQAGIAGQLAKTADRIKLEDTSPYAAIMALKRKQRMSEELTHNQRTPISAGGQAVRDMAVEMLNPASWPLLGYSRELGRPEDLRLVNGRWVTP